jgi:hypothetical protein
MSFSTWRSTSVLDSAVEFIVRHLAVDGRRRCYSGRLPSPERRRHPATPGGSATTRGNNLTQFTTLAHCKKC